MSLLAGCGARWCAEGHQTGVVVLLAPKTRPGGPEAISADDRFEACHRRQHGDWSADCGCFAPELHQRSCSLRSLVNDTPGMLRHFTGTAVLHHQFGRCGRCHRSPILATHAGQRSGPKLRNFADLCHSVRRGNADLISKSQQRPALRTSKLRCERVGMKKFNKLNCPFWKLPPVAIDKQPFQYLPCIALFE